jgi:hypothetical protein
MASSHLARQRATRVHFDHTAHVEHTSGNLPAMIRTPHITVTANAFAARAFAWGNSIGAQFSGLVSGMLPPSH